MKEQHKTERAGRMWEGNKICVWNSHTHSPKMSISLNQVLGEWWSMEAIISSTVINGMCPEEGCYKAAPQSCGLHSPGYCHLSAQPRMTCCRLVQIRAIDCSLHCSPQKGLSVRKESKQWKQTAQVLICSCGAGGEGRLHFQMRACTPSHHLRELLRSASGHREMSGWAGRAGQMLECWGHLLSS